MMKSNVIVALLGAGLTTATAMAGLLDNAWLMGVTDKDPLTYRSGEEMVFTITPKDLDGSVPVGEYFLDWKRTDDYGQVESGKVPLDDMLKNLERGNKLAAFCRGKLGELERRIEILTGGKGGSPEWSEFDPGASTREL